MCFSSHFFCKDLSNIFLKTVAKFLPATQFFRWNSANERRISNFLRKLDSSPKNSTGHRECSFDKPFGKFCWRQKISLLKAGKVDEKHLFVTKLVFLKLSGNAEYSFSMCWDLFAGIRKFFARIANSKSIKEVTSFSKKLILLQNVHLDT